MKFALTSLFILSCLVSGCSPLSPSISKFNSQSSSDNTGIETSVFDEGTSNKDSGFSDALPLNSHAATVQVITKEEFNKKLGDSRVSQKLNNNQVTVLLDKSKVDLFTTDVKIVGNEKYLLNRDIVLYISVDGPSREERVLLQEYLKALIEHKPSSKKATSTISVVLSRNTIDPVSDMMSDETFERLKDSIDSVAIEYLED